jgi:rRNA maturation RNase YbeY
MIKNEGYKIERINYIFCSDNYLLRLNQEHLKHDTYTDVITFQFSEPLEKILADIYISIDRVKENSSSFKNSFTMELYHVMFHGALHLCGYADKRKSDIQLMQSREEFYLTNYLISRETKL